MTRAAVRYGAFPLILFGGTALGVVALERGAHPGVVVAAISVAGAVAVAVLERVAPYRPAWNVPRDDVPTDVVHMLLSTVAIPEVFGVLALGAFVTSAGSLAAAIGTTPWPSGWPWLAQLALALVIGELGQYWMHRLMHETELLWRLHAVHHSAGRLYWLNAGRFHPLDNLLGYTLGTGPLILLGAGTEVLALFTLVTSLHGMFQHANVDLRIGPLNHVFSMAELHRWHHSLGVEGNCNYGANLIVWDTVFGTRFLPPDREPPEAIGNGIPGFPQTWLGHLIVPFRYSKPTS